MDELAADVELLERLEKANNAIAWDAYRRGVDATHELEMAELEEKLAAERGLPPPHLAAGGARPKTRSTKQRGT